MKRLLLILCLVIFISAQAQPDKLIRTYGITKKTETVIIYKDSVQMASFIEEIEMYNPEGEWIEKHIYSSGGELKSQEKRSFDNKGLVIEEKIIDANGSGFKEAEDPSYTRYTYTYDRGDLVERIEYKSPDKVKERRVYAYNKFGDLIEESRFDDDGNLKRREIFEYDDRGLNTRQLKYDGENKLIEEKIITFE